MEILKLCLTSLGSLTALFLLTKLMGNKQMSELSMFDYIVGISIGSIAAEAATELEEFYKPIVTMVIYALAATVISYISIKSIRFRRFTFGKTRLLYKNGTLYRKNLKKSHLDINEVLVRCRSKGFFDLRQLSMILFEPNGKMSFLPRSVYRPATPSDLQIVPPPDEVLFNVIMDGKIMSRNLADSGHDENWLRLQLKTLGERDEKNIFLACADSKQLYIYPWCDREETSDLFE